MNANDMDGLRRRAAAVAASDERFTKATDSEAIAEVDLLTAVIDAIRPALPAMASMIPSPNRERLTVDGVWIAGVRPGARQSGCAVYLLSDGKLLSLDVRSDGDAFTCTPHAMTVDEFADSYDVQAAIGYLDTVLTSQLHGNRDKRTAEAEANARRMRAVVELLAPRK